jgi:DNA-binding transcriptional ArsR family regulator
LSEQEVFQALGDPTRLAIVERLGQHGVMATVPLLEGLGMSRQAATKHLNALEHAGLVRSRTVGRVVLRELQLDVLAQSGDWLLDRAAAWERKLDKLQELVEQSETS